MNFLFDCFELSYLSVDFFNLAAIWGNDSYVLYVVLLQLTNYFNDLVQLLLVIEGVIISLSLAFDIVANDRFIIEDTLLDVSYHPRDVIRAHYISPQFESVLVEKLRAEFHDWLGHSILYI